MMKEYFEKGYKVIASSMWGDVEMQDLDMIECYEEDDDMVLGEVDEVAMIVRFYDGHDYDEEDSYEGI